jgi:hypothetical protein
LSVEGSLLNLQPEDIQLRSDPVGLSRTQILAVLGHFEDIFGSGEMEFKDQLKNIFALQVSPRVLGPLEAEFIEALGLEDFTIEYGFEQPLAVFLSREVFPNTYVSYWSLITGAPSITGATYTLRMSYRLRDLLDFSYIVDSRRIVTLELGVIRRY